MDRQADFCSEPLKILIEKTIYEAYQEQQPRLVEAIADLLKKGQQPTQIEQWVTNQIPTGSQVGNHVHLIASYLIRARCPKN